MSRSTFFIAFFMLASATQLLAKQGESIFDRWSYVDNKTITLHYNLDTLKANRYTENVMRGTIVDGGRRFGVDITVRGRYRRRVCELPPIKLQFDKDLLRLAGLNTHNDYKLVTPCTCDPAGNEALLREQLAYELYQTVDPAASFRTQLLTINYVNTADGSTTSSYAILIEDIDELEDRLDADNCKEGLNAPLTQYTNIERVTLFQYMIGNADFCTQQRRNLKLMRTKDDRLTAVPYDFDYSTLVDPNYVNVGKREFVWKFDQAGDFAQPVADFLAMEDTLMLQVEQFSPLDQKSKRQITKQFKSFFKELRTQPIGS
jgi:hypothetical protein